MNHTVEFDKKNNGLIIDGSVIRRQIDPSLNKLIIDSETIDDNTVIVGYIVRDENPKHPLKRIEGEFFNSGDGLIFTMDQDHEACQSALGYNEHLAPDYNLLDGSVEREMYIAQASTHPEAHEKFSELYKQQYYSSHVDGDTLEDILSAIAAVDYDEGKITFKNELKTIQDFLWEQGRINGTIGNPYAIKVDFNKIGKVSLYTAHNSENKPLTPPGLVGLWVPDEIDIDDIEYHAIQSLLPSGTRAEYTNKEYISPESSLNDISYILPNDVKQGGFTNFVDAIEAAGKALDINLSRDQVIQAGQKVAYIYAQEACAKYTAFLNGNVYSTVLEVFERNEFTWKTGSIDRANGWYDLKSAQKALTFEEPGAINKEIGIDAHKSVIEALNQTQHPLITQNRVNDFVESAVVGKGLSSLEGLTLVKDNSIVDENEVEQ